MDARTEGTKTTKPRGRKDAQKQEAVIECDVIRERKDELIRLYRATGTAAEEWNDGIKAAAEKAGLQSGVVRKFIIACAGEAFGDKKRDAAQLTLLFDEVGG